MIILGFHQGVFSWSRATCGHDAGAAVVVDGEIVAAAEEERFSRVKHTPHFPRGSIRYCLDAAGIDLGQVDRFCFPWNPELDRQNQAQVEIELPALLDRHALRSAVHDRLFDDFARHLAFSVPEERRRQLPHHLCHAASAFYCSSFDRAAILVIDAYGEMTSVSVAMGRGTQIESIEHTLLPTSLGAFYLNYTRLLGFLGTDDEYKVMGLAAYGDPARFRGQFAAQWRMTGAGLVHPSDARSRAAIVELARYRRFEGAPLEQVHSDIAAALQESLEDQVLALARRVRERTGEDRLCLAGGVALNSTANGKLARAGLFRDVFIQPAANDAGTPLGAALLEHYQHATAEHRARDRSTPLSVYLGPAYTDAEIQAACARYAVEITSVRPADLLGEAVARLRAQQILGWFQGRMEYGPRALGNRSILADPQDPQIRDRINRAVKHREPFRPFAPAVLAEHAATRFVMGSVQKSPFMLLTFAARPEHRHGFEAAVHRDGTSRIQTVAREQNPRFHALLERFHLATGVPVLLNTSFNVNGEPIVCSPDDALDSFLSTELDALVIGDWIVERRRPDADAMLAARPALHTGVQLHAVIAAASMSDSPWRHAAVTWRHHRVELEPGQVPVVLACDGRRTGEDLLAVLGTLPGEDRARQVARLCELLERLLRLRILRLV